MRNPYAAAARAISLLYSVTSNLLQHELREQIEEDIATLKEVSEEFDRMKAGYTPTADDVEAAVDAFNRDGVDGPGGSLPAGWGLDEDGVRVVREEDGLTLANAYVLRAVLAADPTGENVQVYDVAAHEAFNLDAVSADLDPTYGIVIHYVGASAAVARTYDPDRKAPEPEVEAPAPAPEPEPAPAPESTTASDETPAGPESQPDWTGFDEDPAKWTPEQHLTFDDWFDGLPDGAEVNINHIGVVQAFTAAKAEWEAEKKADAAQEGGQDAQVEGATATGTTETAETAPEAAPAAEKDAKKKP